MSVPDREFLTAHAYNATVEQKASDADVPALRDWAPPLSVPARGDGLYDLSKILLQR